MSTFPLTCKQAMAQTLNMKEFRGILILGKKLRELRREDLSSQESFGRLFGMSKGRISELERANVASMNAEKFKQLAKAMNKSTDQLKKLIGAPASATPDGDGHRKVVVSKVVYDGLSRLAARDKKTIEQLLADFVGGSIDENYQEFTPATEPEVPPTSGTRARGSAAKSATGR